MKKLLSAFCLSLMAVVFASAQTTDFKRSEFYGGYSNQQVDTGANSDTGNTARDFFNDRLSFNGFEAAGVYNVSRYVGIKGDFSGAYRNRDFRIASGAATTNFETRNSLYNVLGGVQVKDNASEARLKPFGHAMVGVGVARTKIENFTTTTTGTTTTTLFGDDSFTDRGVAMAFGGGLDIKLSNKVDLRAVQIDYNPIRLNGSFDHNVRFGIGFVIR